MKSPNLKLSVVAATAVVLAVFSQPARTQTGFSDSYPLNTPGQHLFYIGSDQHVHELYGADLLDMGEAYTYYDLDLFQQGSSQPADFFGSGAPIASSDVSGEQVYYLDNSFNVHRLNNANAAVESISEYISGAGWQDSTLFPAKFLSGSWTGTSSIAAINDNAGESIFFITGNNANVYWLFCPKGGNCNTLQLGPGNGSWILGNLTVETGAPPAVLPASGTAPVRLSPATSHLASSADASGDEYLFYFDASQHVVELSRSTAGCSSPATCFWTWQDLTSLAGSSNPLAGIHLAALGSGLNYFRDSGWQHVVFEDTNQHINQLYQPVCVSFCIPGVWVSQDLSAQADAAPAASYSVWSYSLSLHSPLSGLKDGFGVEHIFYFDVNGGVDDLYLPSGGSWTFQSAAGQAADHCSGLTVYNGEYEGESTRFYVAYISGSQVRQLSPGYYDLDMTSAFGGPGAKYPCAF